MLIHIGILSRPVTLHLSSIQRVCFEPDDFGRVDQGSESERGTDDQSTSPGSPPEVLESSYHLGLLLSTDSGTY